jgi:hypothetical protein
MPVDKNELLDRKWRLARQPDAGLQDIDENKQGIISGVQAADRNIKGKDVYPRSDFFMVQHRNGKVFFFAGRRVYKKGGKY